MSRTDRTRRSSTSLAVALPLAATLLTAGCAGITGSAHAGGCREDGTWSPARQAQWLRPAVSFPQAAAADEAVVVIRPHLPADGGPLCEPIPVQVQFWKLTATATGTDMTPALRIRLARLGSRERTIGFPAGLSTGERDSCTGVLMAAYTGAPLDWSELPDDTGRLGSGTSEVRFRTDRIAAYRLLPPSAPHPCRTAGQSTPAPPPPPATANPWGLHHP
ncbi:hypothetical protein ABZT06_18295 [Streptomyces sp. NPDC005483]|uniref:hypothetical protein n=1 Tax=Streptomyces sp. NPDC005483 TaxID=3154882 RepID=UPI0033A8A74E